MFSIFGIQWVITKSIKEALLGWHDSFIGRSCAKAWRAAPLCIFLDHLQGKKLKMF